MAFALAAFTLLASCRKDPAPDSDTELTELSGPFLGQTPPGNNPVRFAPNNLFIAGSNTWWYHGSPVFSPDGNEMYFVKYFANQTGAQIWFTKNTKGHWTVPVKAPFSTSHFDNNPLFITSNDTLYFQSQRGGGYIFRVTRTATGWSNPVALNMIFPSNSGIGNEFWITKNKTIYFEVSGNNGSIPGDIYRAKFVNGRYIMPENIGSPINTAIGEMVGYVDPDERYMIYCSKKEGGYGWHDLYISFSNQDGTWNSPVNLGSRINTGEEDIAPYITPDGKYFFYNSIKAGDNGYTPYWVDAGFIEALK